MTPASWYRTFIRSHPAYKHDSVVSAEICYDLARAVDEMYELFLFFFLCYLSCVLAICLFILSTEVRCLDIITLTHAWFSFSPSLLFPSSFPSLILSFTPHFTTHTSVFGPLSFGVVVTQRGRHATSARADGSQLRRQPGLVPIPLIELPPSASNRPVIQSSRQQL